MQSPSLAPVKIPPTKTPTITQSPTLAVGAAGGGASTNVVGAALGSIVAILVVGLAAFVIYRRGGSKFFVPEGATQINWLAQVDMNVPRTAPVPEILKANSFESGNPIYTGIVRDRSAATPPIKLSRDQIFTKLKTFYNKVDPGKSEADIKDLSDWVMVYGEEALYVKLRRKYACDPNTVAVSHNSGGQPKLILSGDVNV